MYTVTSSHNGSNAEIGQYDTLELALAAARNAGAVIPRKGPCTEVGLNVRGWEWRDDCAIWVEAVRQS